MNLFQSCCCDEEKVPREMIEEKLDIVQEAPADEFQPMAVSIAALTDQNPTGVQEKEKEPKAIDFDGRPVSTTPSVSNVISLTNMDSEKSRLRELVSKFGRRAGVGAPCTYVPLSGDSKKRGKFHLDKPLRQFWIVSDADGKLLHPILAMDKLQSVTNNQEDTVNAEKLMGRDAIPKDVADMLNGDELVRAVLITYTSESGEDSRLLLLEESAELAKTFADCMKVLLIYASKKRN